MISLLVPSRARPDNIARLYDSILETTTGTWELIVRLDDDDTSAYPARLNLTYVIGPRNTLSSLWNDCYDAAHGDILWQGGDDVVFRSPDWDSLVRGAFPPDNIAFIHGDDLGNRGVEFGTHGFIHRKWVETVGYFTPPFFSSDYADRWLNDIANILDRRYFWSFVTEHLHPGFGKAPLDDTYNATITRAKLDRPDLIYARSAQRRLDDAQKLLEVMDV